MATSNNPFEDYATKREFCQLVPGGPISHRTADRWHALRVGPPRVRIGRTVLYPKEGIRHWLESRRQEPVEQR